MTRHWIACIPFAYQARSLGHYDRLYDVLGLNGFLVVIPGPAGFDALPAWMAVQEIEGGCG